MMIEWKVLDQIATGSLEVNLNELYREDYEIYRLEWVLTNEVQTENSNQAVPSAPSYVASTGTYSYSASGSQVIATTARYGHWIVVACRAIPN